MMRNAVQKGAGMEEEEAHLLLESLTHMRAGGGGERGV